MKTKEVISEISLGNYRDKALKQKAQSQMGAMFARDPEEREKNLSTFNKREKGLNRLKARDEKSRKAAADKDMADTISQLPKLKDEYEQMKAKYKSLGGSNWQYADRDQNLTDREREARSMEGPMNNLWRRINAAEKSQKSEGANISERVTPEWVEVNRKAKELLATGMTVDQVAKQLGVQGPNNGMSGSMGGLWGAINSAKQQMGSGKMEGAKWRDPKYKDKLYRQEPDSDAKVPMGGVTQSDFINMANIGRGDRLAGRTSNTDGRYGDITVASKGKRKGMLTKNAIDDLKGDIKRGIGKHRKPNLPEDEGKQEIGQQMADDGVTYSPEKENEIIDLMSQYMEKAGMSRKQIRYLLSYDEDYIGDQLSFLPRKDVTENANMLKVAKDDDKQTILQNPSTGVQTQIDKTNPNAPRLTQDEQGKLKLAAPMGAGGQQQQQQKPTLVGKDVEVATESAALTAMLKIAGLR
jgi:hypothetical protein